MAVGNHEDERNLLLQSHLSQDEAEAEFHEFEFALHHISEAFARWSSSVHEFVSGEFLAQPDVSVLQLIRMNEEPKSAADIGRYLNRDDSSNILYALRKLEKAGLIEKGDGPLRQTTYRVTARGMDLTDRYAKVRKDVLLSTLGATFQGEQELSAAIKTMWRICGLYEQGARSISVMRVLQGDRQAELRERAVPAKPAAKRASSGKPKGAAGAARKAG
ncbi:winged helix DNA-binding protein [Novosphingobium sp. AP12]|uniref:helix-turn-helix domain-containing protein n=1 Tax=Novosphingobium sp. AP12 TaxID=1144305 RepID=UPI000271D884|nr:winged helix DNA-binding protein [Novosphingobium sp. AP12]EJL33548.1 putative transcription regulator, contains HTH domain (MarR family) [Novosphingobium sp. AP12]